MASADNNHPPLNPELSEDKLIKLDYIANRLGISERETKRCIPEWQGQGFPAKVRIGYRTVRYSNLVFQKWFNEFISKTKGPSN